MISIYEHMTKIKNTKSSTFLFPLLEIPKNIFVCDIKTSYKRTLYNTRFINTYLKDKNVNSYLKAHLFILIENYQDKDFSAFYSTMTAFPNYVDDYEFNGYLIMVYKVSDERIEDYQLVLDGKYSKISEAGKKLILSNHFYHGKSITIALILAKSSSLRESWEEQLSTPKSYVDLGDQEVWSKIMQEKEIITPELISELKVFNKLSPSKEFE